MFTLWFLLVAVLTASAQEPLRPQCSSGRHQRKAVVAYSNTKSGSRRVSPFSGQKRQLVILAEFNDKKYQVEEPLTLWNDIFNQLSAVKNCNRSAFCNTHATGIGADAVERCMYSVIFINYLRKLIYICTD